MKAYECVTILDPKLDETEVERIIAKVEDNIQKSGNVLENTNRWGKRRLAYEIKKVNEAYYVLFNYKADEKFNREFEKFLKFTNGVLRAMTVCAHVEKKAPKAIQTM